MPERINFMCVGKTTNGKQLDQNTVMNNLTMLGGKKVIPQEILRINTRTGAEQRAPWHAGVELSVSHPTDVELLFAYFKLDNVVDLGVQNISFAKFDQVYGISLSLTPESIGPTKADPIKIMLELSQITAGIFDHAIFAAGPELDFGRLEFDCDLDRFERDLANDWRCWSLVVLRNFPERFGNPTSL